MTNYIINSNFKAVRKGSHVKPNEEAGEFLYVTGEDSLTIGQMEDIAKSNGFAFKTSGKKKTDVQNKFDEGLENMTNVAEQNGPTQSEIVEEIVSAGVADELSDDEMLISIIQAGIPFRQAGRVFNETMERLGLRVSTKAVKETAQELLEQMEFNPETWADVEEAVQKIMGEVEGAERKQAMTAVRAFCRTEEIELPKKEKGRRGRIGFRNIAQNWMLENPDASEDDFTEFLKENDKEPEKMKAYYHLFAFAKEFHEKVSAAE